MIISNKQIIREFKLLSRSLPLKTGLESLLTKEEVYWGCYGTTSYWMVELLIFILEVAN